MTQRRTLDPKLDIVFKMLFGRPENRELLLSLLGAVLNPPVPIASVRVESELDAEAVDQKSIALDIHVELDDGQQVDVEMQTHARPARRERALYYWARMYAGQLGHGDGYQKLRRCVVVLIVPFNELEGQRFHSIFRVSELDDHKQLSDQLEIHLLELSKLELPPETNREQTLVNWGRFLRAGSDEELEKLAMTDPVLRKAKVALEELSADPGARLRAEQRELALQSYWLDLGKAHQEGLAEGRVEGLAEGRVEGLAEGRVEGLAALLLHQLTAKFGVVPAPIRGRVEGAKEAELLGWAEKVLLADSLEAVFD